MREDIRAVSMRRRRDARLEVDAGRRRGENGRASARGARLHGCGSPMFPHATPDSPGRDPAPLAADLLELEFGDRFVRELAADPDTRNQTREVRDASYTRVEPTPVAAPRLLAWSDELGEWLGIARPASVDAPAVQVLSGNRLAPGMAPFAARYGGHQFGNWAGQLGDGRAITLGERRARDGVAWELQLKGAGRTPYSRHADGRAVLRSSLREFLCSEAMHWLGVPTTRALSLVATGMPVVRDMFYDGHAAAEPGAIVCRAAPSFVRFGNFEIHAACGEHDLLRRLADHVIRHHAPQYLGDGAVAPCRLVRDVCRATARTIARWMGVGFVHGVMNTDNMSILGLTIDYGPYGWLEGFDPGWTPNTTDAAGRRYCYGNQPQIGMWNLSRLAGALLPLVADRAALEQGLEAYRDEFQREYTALFAAKLGLDGLDRDGDTALFDGLFEVLGATEIDMTIFFRSLARVPLDAAAATRRGWRRCRRRSTTRTPSAARRACGSRTGCAATSNAPAPTRASRSRGASAWIASTRSTCRATISRSRPSMPRRSATRRCSSDCSTCCVVRTTNARVANRSRSGGRNGRATSPAVRLCPAVPEFASVSLMVLRVPSSAAHARGD
jgi:serine/tyrosine/threonine adenylyltransferase